MPTATPPAPLVQPRNTAAGRRTSSRKLNGQFFTPLDVATAMVEALPWPAAGDGVLLDPCCGDGIFLEAAMRKVLRTSLPVAKKQTIITEQIWGWDIDPAALEACKARLRDVLKGAGMPDAEPRIAHRNALDGLGPNEAVRWIVTNPPYLEAKRMPAELKMRVKEACPLTACGAFDLYGAFVELAWRWLPTDGAFSLLIPNRFLVASYGKKMRHELLKGAAVTITDLSTEDVFADAAVYPIVLRAQRNNRATFTVQQGVGDGEPCRALAPEALLRRLHGMMPLPPADPDGARFFEQVLEDGTATSFSDLCTLRWTVSFHRSGLRDKFVSANRPDSPHAARFLGGHRFSGNREVGHYSIDWAGAWIDYDIARSRDEKNTFPGADVHRAPKVVVCQNVRRPRAALDREGFILKDTLLSLRLQAQRDPAWLPWVVLVLNSDVFHYLYEHAYGGTRKGGGFLHMLPRYLLPFPCPELPADTTHLWDLHDALGAAATTRDWATLAQLHSEAEKLVRHQWHVSESANRALDAYPYPALANPQR